MTFYAVNQVINGKIDSLGMVRIRAFCQIQFILVSLEYEKDWFQWLFFTLKERNKQNDCTAILKALEEHFTILISFE